MDNNTDSKLNWEVSSVLRREAPEASRRSVKFSAVPSAAVMKALLSKTHSSKIKTTRQASRSSDKSYPKLIFDYGPTTYRGVLLHRKLKLAPFAETLQKNYPQIRVCYHPITTYNVVSVRLKDSVVVKLLISNVSLSTTEEDITKNSFYIIIDEAIQRMLRYPNLLAKPFRDVVCLMTHNLDIDYDIPWYRTEFPRKLETENKPQDERKMLKPLESQQSPFTKPSRGGSRLSVALQAAPCLVDLDLPMTDSVHWENFRRSFENTVDFKKFLESEFCNEDKLVRAKVNNAQLFIRLQMNEFCK